MRNPEDSKYVWDKENFNIIKKNIVKEKRHFVGITIKDAETSEPVRTVFTSSDYPESFFSNPHPDLMREIHGCVDILCSIHFGNDKQFKL